MVDLFAHYVVVDLVVSVLLQKYQVASFRSFVVRVVSPVRSLTRGVMKPKTSSSSGRTVGVEAAGRRSSCSRPRGARVSRRRRFRGAD